MKFKLKICQIFPATTSTSGAGDFLTQDYHLWSGEGECMLWAWYKTWTGLDWTVGLDWIGLILIYIFKCFAPQSFDSQKFTYKDLPVISYCWLFVSKWVRDIWVLIQCIFFTKHCFKRIYVSFGRVCMRIFDAHIYALLLNTIIYTVKNDRLKQPKKIGYLSWSRTTRLK